MKFIKDIGCFAGEKERECPDFELENFLKHTPSIKEHGYTKFCVNGEWIKSDYDCYYINGVNVQPIIDKINIELIPL